MAKKTLLILITALWFAGMLNASDWNGKDQFTLDRAFSLYFENKLDASEKVFLSYLENYGENEIVYRYLAQIAAQKNNSAAAKKYLKEALRIKPDDMESLLLLANLHLGSMEYKEAIAAFQKVVEIDEYHEIALNSLGYLYTQQKQIPKAIQSYKRAIIAINKNGNAPMAMASLYTEIGNLYSQQEDDKNAIIYIAKAYELLPDNDKIGIFLGRLYAITGNFEKSINTLESVVKFSPGNPEALYLISEISYILQRPDTLSIARKYKAMDNKPDALIDGIIEELTGKDKESELKFYAVLSNEPRRLSAHIGRYRIEEREKNRESMKNRSLFISGIAQEYSAYSISQLYMQKYFTIMNEISQEKDFHKKFFLTPWESGKITDFFSTEEVSSIDGLATAFREAYIHYGSILEGLEQPLLAMVYYKRSIHISQREILFMQKKMEARLISGKALGQYKQERENSIHKLNQSLAWLYNQEKIRNVEQSHKYIDRAIGMNLADPFDYYFKGFLYFHYSQDKKAGYLKSKDLFQTSVKMYTDRKQEPPGEFYYYLAMAWEKTGDFVRMEKLMDKAIKLNPANANYLNYLAYTYSQNATQLNRAKDMIRAALEIEPENAAYLDSYGWILFRMGNYAKSVQPLLLAADIAEKNKQPDAVIYFHLAESYFQMQEFAMAGFYYDKTTQHWDNASEDLDKDYIRKRMAESKDKQTNHVNPEEKK